MENDTAPRKRPLFDSFFAYLDARLPSDRIIIYALMIVFVSAASIALLSLNRAYSVSVPNSGGTLAEGLVGTPRFVNPVLAITRTDTDLVSLIYSGLMKIDTTGALVPDLAESVTVSDDGLVYNVILRDDVQFHDGTPIHAEDVAYTIELIQDPELKSPLRGNWSGVDVEVLGDRELNFVLEKPYTPFLENLTVGIMPKHIWDSLSIEELPFSQHNTDPIGSGPYKVANDSRNKSGLINGYTLRAFTDGRPTAKIDTIAIHFYQNEDDLLAAYQNGQITSTANLSYSAVAALESDSSTVVYQETLPRLFAVFFNQNRSTVLRDKSARAAFDAAIDRETLIAEVLDGYGSPAHSPIPPGFFEGLATSTESTRLDTKDHLETARQILRDGEWTQNENGQWTKEIDEIEIVLAITITTANTTVFENTAYYLEHVWKELGAEVKIELYEQSDLVQTAIRPRSYEALLFGAEIGRALDLYPFWHSSQREDPGLNVALYTNITTDTLLDTARTTQDDAERTTSLLSFEAEIANETPAIFLYSPSFTYVMQQNVKPTAMDRIARPSERFANISEWYMNEQSVWHLFVTE